MYRAFEDLGELERTVVDSSELTVDQNGKHPDPIRAITPGASHGHGGTEVRWIVGIIGMWLALGASPAFAGSLGSAGQASDQAPLSR